MGRKSGMLVHCTCTVCGAIELRTGCNDRFRCVACRPVLTPFVAAKKAAHAAVSRARRLGTLPSPRNFQCVDCGKKAIEYDHRDYAKPLDVQPVCRSCNLLRGRALVSA